MTVLALEAIAGALPAGAAIAGLDLGDKTIGIAVSDRGLSFANPRAVLRRTKFGADAAVLLARLAEDGVGAIVVGLPMNMDGSAGPRVQSTKAFVRNLERLTALPFAYWDERLSTVAAERALLEMDVSRAKRRDRIDSAAAAFILQGALDRLRTLAYSAGAGGSGEDGMP